MTEDDRHIAQNEQRHEQQHEYNGRSASQLVHELCRLMLVLVWRFIVWLLKKFLKGVLWSIKMAEKGLNRLNVWWHDNDTQEKKAKVIAWMKLAAKKAGEYGAAAGRLALKGCHIGLIYAVKGLKIAARATAIGIVIGAKATVQGILHLKTTLKRLKRLAAVAQRSIGRWNQKRKRGDRLRSIKRKRAQEEFRRNGGMKGLIMRSTNNVKKNITMFMEEDQDESDPDALTNEELMEEALEKGASEGKKGMKIGKSILSHANDFLNSK